MASAAAASGDAALRAVLLLHRVRRLTADVERVDATQSL